MRTAALTKTKWGIDPAHSEFGFKVKHLMITYVKGVFRETDVIVFTEGDDFLTSEIEVRINAGSVYTGDERRDQHLRSPDFFDVDNHKQIVFIGRKVERKKDNHFKLYGPLSIKGIAVQVQLNVDYEGIMKDPWGIEKVGFTVTGEISRKDWELNWNAALESGGVLVGDVIVIGCEIQLMKRND